MGAKTAMALDRLRAVVETSTMAEKESLRAAVNLNTN
jgi:hypothetical protein